MDKEIWLADAYAKVIEFCRKSGPGRAFNTQELAMWAYGVGLLHPIDARSWGGVMHRAARAGVIRHGGFGTVKYENTTSNPRVMARWLTA